MKSNLNCLATNCEFNHDGYCYASYIQVNGYDATDNSETNCDTYKQKTSSYTASFDSSTLANTQSISCCVKNCTYNICGGCNADHVLINREQNRCDNFRLKH